MQIILNILLVLILLKISVIDRESSNVDAKEYENVEMSW